MTQAQLELPLPPRTRTRLADEDFPVERSPWEIYEQPPMPGWWEIFNVGANAHAGVWWWDGTLWHSDRRMVSIAPTMNHQEFRRRDYAWRGLCVPSPDVYPCPPYSSSVLLPAAQRAGVAIRTPYASITTAARVRAYLEQE